MLRGGACRASAASGPRRPDPLRSVVGAADHTDPVSDPDDEDRVSEPYHPVDRELEVSRTYADPDAFDDDDITDRLQHYEAMQLRGDLVPRQRAVLDRIVARLGFEFVRRMEEEFAPKPGDDDYLTAYDDPDLIERDFEDPLDR